MHEGEHIRIYDAYFGLDGSRQARICEITGRPGAEIAHIDASGMGGRSSAHTIDNLMALDPVVHRLTEGVTVWKEWLRVQHRKFMEDRRPTSEHAPMDETYSEIFRKCYVHLQKRWS